MASSIWTLAVRLVATFQCIALSSTSCFSSIICFIGLLNATFAQHYWFVGWLNDRLINFQPVRWISFMKLILLKAVKKVFNFQCFCILFTFSTQDFLTHCLFQIGIAFLIAFLISLRPTLDSGSSKFRIQTWNITNNYSYSAEEMVEFRFETTHEK